jgi:hypothetical protein
MKVTDSGGSDNLLGVGVVVSFTQLTLEISNIWGRNSRHSDLC